MYVFNVPPGCLSQNCLWKVVVSRNLHVAGKTRLKICFRKLFYFVGGLRRHNILIFLFRMGTFVL